MYRDMRCQHHFIQDRETELPHIPALTPHGFQEWMTAMILAYPATEYERLAKAVLDMPVSVLPCTSHTRQADMLTPTL